MLWNFATKNNFSNLISFTSGYYASVMQKTKQQPMLFHHRKIVFVSHCWRPLFTDTRCSDSFNQKNILRS